MRIDNTRERLGAENVTERYRKARLRWFGHVDRPDQYYYVGRNTLDMVAYLSPARRGRPKQIWNDWVNIDMRVRDNKR